MLIFHFTHALYAHVRCLRVSNQRWVAGACFIVAVGYLVRPKVPLEAYAALSPAKTGAALASAIGSQFVAGDYWTTWPLVFELLNIRGHAFGLAYRAEGNRERTLDALNSELEDRGDLRIFCSSASARECSDELAQITNRKWKVNQEMQFNDSAMLVMKPEDFNPDNYDMTRLSFAPDEEGKKYLLSGWSIAEQWGTWSDGMSASILLKLPGYIDRDLMLTIQAHALINEKHPEQEVDVIVNRHLLGTLEYTTNSDQVSSLRIPKVLLSENNGKVLIHFDFKNPKSPANLGMSRDVRRVGLGLVSLQLSLKE